MLPAQDRGGPATAAARGGVGGCGCVALAQLLLAGRVAQRLVAALQLAAACGWSEGSMHMWVGSWVSLGVGAVMLLERVAPRRQAVQQESIRGCFCFCCFCLESIKKGGNFFL